MYIKVKVTAGVKNEKIVQSSSDHFDISVKEKAERNMANTKVIDIIAVHFNVPRGKVRIVNGHHSPAKLLSVDFD